MMSKAKTTLANLSGLSALRLAREPGAEIPEPTKAKEAPAEQRVRAREVRPVEEVPVAPVSRLIEQPRSVGRPKTGKRSNEDFRNVTVYIRRDTHSDADDILRHRRRKAQIAEGEPRDVSELVQYLLADWLSKQPER
jgi:hypothetical protein